MPAALTAKKSEMREVDMAWVDIGPIGLISLIGKDLLVE